METKEGRGHRLYIGGMGKQEAGRGKMPHLRRCADEKKRRTHGAIDIKTLGTHASSMAQNIRRRNRNSEKAPAAVLSPQPLVVFLTPWPHERMER